MKSAFVIAKKEARAFFTQPTFYVIAGLLTVVFSFLFIIGVTQFAQVAQSMMMQPGAPAQQGNIHYAVFLRHLSILNLMLIFVVPAFTMKLFSEEKKMRTFDLLLTCPVNSVEIAMGKFLGAAAAVGGIVLIALIYPVSSIIFVQKISWAPLLISFLGLYLVGLVYVSMNLFCSSLTESILISYIMSVILNVSIWFVGQGVEMVDGQVARQIFEHISLNYHLAGLVEGTIRSQSLIFLLSLSGLFIFLTERVVESHRWRA